MQDKTKSESYPDAVAKASLNYNTLFGSSTTWTNGDEIIFYDALTYTGARSGNGYAKITRLP